MVKSTLYFIKEKTQITDVLEEAAELVGRFSDVHTELDSKERQRLRTHRRHQHLVF